MDPQSIQEWKVGLHQIRWEPPDLLKITWKGVVLEEHADFVNDIFASIAVPRYWLLSNISDSETPSPQVRTKLSKNQASHQIAGVAVVVSSSYQRAIMHMLIRAVNLLSKTKIKSAFFQSEKDAQAWITAERQRLDG